MPTADRTTIRAAMDEFMNKLKSNLVADPTTVTKPFRRVFVGEAGDEEFPRPFLAVRLTEVAPLGATDDDKLFEVSMVMRLVTDAVEADPHGAILDKIGATEDYLDSIRDTGVLEGAEGFDERDWSFAYPRTTSGARVVAAEARQTCVVKVKRQQNRVA